MTIMQSKLAQQHEPVAKEIDKLLQECRTLGASEGAQRLELICDQYNQLSPNTAYLWVDLNAFQQEIEEAQTHTFTMELVHFLRNCFSLAPLIVTWGSLFIAMDSYQKYLAIAGNDKQVPFLELWQNGFNGITGLTFTTVAGLDVVLLFLYLFFVLLTRNIERRARVQAVKFVRKLQSKVDEIIKYTKADTAHVGDQSDIDRVVNGVQRVINTAVAAMTQIVNHVADTNKQAIDNLERAVKLVATDVEHSIQQTTHSSTQAITEANNKVEDLFKQQIIPMITTFHADMGTLHKELGNYQGRLNDLTSASQQLANASQQLVTASLSLTDNAERYVTIGQDISTQIASLNTTQNDVLLQIESVANSITTAAGNMTTATSNMGTALKMVEGVTYQLDSGMRTTIETMTNNVNNATRALAQVGPQLYQTSTYLYHAATQLSFIQPNPPGFIRRIMQNFRRQPPPQGGQHP